MVTIDSNQIPAIIDLIKKQEVNAEKRVASLCLVSLRHCRDNAPKEWDALMKTESGLVMSSLWDYLRGIEGEAL